MTRLERREQALLKIHRKRCKYLSPEALPTDPALLNATTTKKKNAVHIDVLEQEAMPYTPPEFHHHISLSRNFHTNIAAFLAENKGDPAIKVSRTKVLYCI